MAKDPAFLFYSQDFLVGVMDMDWEERGKYITLLSTMHQKGRLKEKTIRFLVGSVSDNLKEKFSIDEDGLWFNERLEEEIEKRRNFVESRRINAKKGGRPKKDKANENPIGKPNGKHKDNLMGNEDVNENEDTILMFWHRSFGRMPNYPEREETQNLIDKFGDEKTLRIMKDGVRNNFKSIFTLSKSLDQYGNIKPKDSEEKVLELRG